MKPLLCLLLALLVTLPALARDDLLDARLDRLKRVLGNYTSPADLRRKGNVDEGYLWYEGEQRLECFFKEKRVIFVKWHLNRGEYTLKDVEKILTDHTPTNLKLKWVEWNRVDGEQRWKRSDGAMFCRFFERNATIELWSSDYEHPTVKDQPLVPPQGAN